MIGASTIAWLEKNSTTFGTGEGSAVSTEEKLNVLPLGVELKKFLYTRQGLKKVL